MHMSVPTHTYFFAYNMARLYGYLKLVHRSICSIYIRVMHHIVDIDFGVKLNIKLLYNKLVVPHIQVQASDN